jgi:adenylate cyclase
MAKKKHQPKLVVSILIGIVAIAIALFVANIPTIASLELSFLDFRFQMRGPLDVSESPVIILAIDDQSDESTPDRWPWPRSYFAHVIENLNDAGAKVIGVDVIFDQPDINGTESDDQLAQILNKYDNVVLSGKVTSLRGRANQIIQVPPYSKFTESGTLWGLVSSEVDEDGIYREYLVGQSVLDTTFSSFATEILKLYYGYDRNLELQNLPDQFVFGDHIIPKFSVNSMIINYYGHAGTFKYFSFDNVLDDEDFDLVEEYDLNSFDDPGFPEDGIPPGPLHSDIFKDKIILIGSTMQELHDDFPTPYLEIKDESGKSSQALMPGVETHANALQTIFDQNYLSEIGFWENLILLILLSVLLYLFSYYLPTGWGIALSTLLILIYFGISLFLFAEFNFISEITTPVFLIISGFGGHTLYQYLLSQKEKKLIQGAFSHYVPEKVVSKILENPDQLKLGGELQVVSVMFTDVAGFTSISEKLTPTQLVQLLNDYLTEMTDIVLKNNGIIDKYEGDAIMAEFGVPVHYDNHPYMACKTALEMQRKLKEMRDFWKKQNKPMLKARIGINTGEVIVGNMGSRDVFDYTVMGDHVNLGARLEGANKFYGTNIMISEFTQKIVKDQFYTRPLDLIKVKGKDKPIKVYELIAFKEDKLKDNYLQMLQSYEEGIEFYKSRSWDDAIDSFEKCLKLVHVDAPSEEYKRRCIEYKFNQPAEGWDGVTVMTEK